MILTVIAVLGLAADLNRNVQEGRYPQALAETEALLQQQPSNPRLWTMRGIVLDKLKRPQESLASYLRALDISPKMLAALEGATAVAYRLHHRRAAEFADRVLALEPGNQTAQAISAALAFEGHDCGKAIAHFERAREAIAQNAAALTQYGACLVESGRAEDGVRVFRQTLALKPGEAVGVYNLALALHQARQNGEAITLLEKLPSASGTLNLLAACYAEENKISEAVATLRKATELAPKDESNYIDLATLCVDHLSPELAVEIAGIGIRNNPGSARLYTLRGTIRAHEGQTELAQQDFDQAMKLEPDKLYGSVGLSVLLREKADTPKAIALLRQRLREKPAEPTLNYLLADTLVRDGAEPGQPAFDEAIALLKTCVQANPDFGKAHAELGKLYLRQNKTAAAIEELNRAVQLEPSNHTAVNQLILALRRNGDKQRAGQMAARLREILEQERKQEVAHNRVRLVAEEQSGK